ncbi:MAG: ECF transporter S component [Candidatus Improbicoccus devescovinae]|nr:MAG: ECF transporter S component [Candidatus Improbicoccus devescovinae]
MIKYSNYSNCRQLAINAFLATISLIFILISRMQIIPFPFFLRLEFSDAPIFAATLIFGVQSGILILIAVCFIRSIFFSTIGYSGFIMRIISIIPIISLGIYNKISSKFYKNLQKRYLILCMLLGILWYIIIKIPISFLFWVYLHNFPSEFIKKIIPTIIIPVNIIKISFNYLLGIYIANLINKVSDIVK